nr:MAG TPA_asm: hypothetical protein [Microviridae sp.]
MKKEIVFVIIKAIVYALTSLAASLGYASI